MKLTAEERASLSVQARVRGVINKSILAALNNTYTYTSPSSTPGTDS